MANLQTAKPPCGDMKIQNQPLILKTYVSSGSGSVRPSTGQMYPRTK